MKIPDVPFVLYPEKLLYYSHEQKKSYSLF